MHVQNGFHEKHSGPYGMYVHVYSITVPEAKRLQYNMMNIRN